jgi:hypothetical protein
MSWPLVLIQTIDADALQELGGGMTEETIVLKLKYRRRIGRPTGRPPSP